MSITEIIGYIGAALIGVSLGLIGGGGSILTVPVLVYFFALSPVLSTAYSLFVVGISALVGAVKNMQKGLVSYKTAVVFAIPSFVAVFATRYYFVPAIPEILFTVGDFTMTKSIGIMVFFAIVMLLAAISMIRSKNQKNTSTITEDIPRFNYPLILLEGALVGVLTGIVGAGGGFLIIPALVLLAKLPMKLAVGTSLLIIAAKSLIGFLGDLGTGRPIDWGFLIIFTGIAALGIFIGAYFSNFFSGQKLKAGFGLFVLVMAIYILIKEVLLNH